MSDAIQVSGKPILRAVLFDRATVSALFTPSSASQGGYVAQVTNPGGPTITVDAAQSWVDVPGRAQPIFFTLDVLKMDGTVDNRFNQQVTFPGTIPQLRASDAVRFADGSIRVRWTALISAELDSYLLLLRDRQGNAVVAEEIAGLNNSQGSLLIGREIGQANTLQFRLAALGKERTGPACAPMSLIGAAPSNVRVEVNSDQLEVCWTPSQDPLASQQIPRLYSVQDGWFSPTIGSSDRSGHGSVAFDPKANKSWFVVVVAAGDAQSVVSAASEPVLVPMDSPKLLQVKASAEAVTVAAGATTATPSGVTQVLFRALSGGTEVARATSSGSPVALRADSATVEAIAWRAEVDGSLAVEQQLSVSLAAVALPAIATDAATGSSKLTWTAVADANGYWVDLGDGDKPRLVTGATEFALPPEALGSAFLSARVSAQFSVAGTTVRAMPSLPCGPLPSAPADVSTLYDGITVYASWDGVPGALAYVVTAYDPAGNAVAKTVSVAAPSTSTSFALAAGDRGQDWVLVVQSVQSQATGLAGAKITLTEPGWYVKAPNTSAAVNSAALAPFAGAAQVHAFASGQGVAYRYLLPALGTGALRELPATDSFKLSANADSNFPYALEIPADSGLWQFDGSPIRSSLRRDLAELLSKLEIAGANAQGLDLIQRVIARGAPLTFQETLLVQYGLTGPASDIGQGYGSFDLRPGMVLRIAAASYVDMGPDGSDDYLNGFASASTIDYHIGTHASGNSWRPQLDSFASELTTLGALKVKAPPRSVGGNAQGGIADSADLLYPALAQPFLRVIVPDTLLAAADGGSAQANSQFSIVGASSYAQLRAITSPPSASTPYAFFLGRCVLNACVEISVNGQSTLVQLGTTLADVLASRGALPANTTAALANLQLLRKRGAVVTDAKSPLEPGAADPVRIDWLGLTPWRNANALAVPLLSGDQLWF